MRHSRLLEMTLFDRPYTVSCSWSIVTTVCEVLATVCLKTLTQPYLRPRWW